MKIFLSAIFIQAPTSATASSHNIWLLYLSLPVKQLFYVAYGHVACGHGSIALVGFLVYMGLPSLVWPSSAR